ncbi:MAG: response regulator [Acidobacteriota bacterium]
MKRVLFVDDDRNVVQGLRRMLRSLRHEWDVQLASSGPAALEAIKERAFDIVVSDMKMPGMDGADLLTRVKCLHPDSIRIILSGHSERKAILKSVAPAHQYLLKPCEAETLKETIERAYALRALLRCSKLKELVSQIDSLPSVPSLYQGLVTELKKPDASLHKIAKTMEQDIGMSANILKLVNSAYFGLFKPVTSVERSVTHLGLETINDLLSIPIFSEYKGPEIPGFSLETLWRHSMRTAAFARIIAREEEPEGRLAAEAFQAGILHDAGQLILAARIPERYGQVLQRAAADGTSVSTTEGEMLGGTHAEVGAYLIGLWGLPEPIVEAVAYHSRPRECPRMGFGPLAAVHVANALALEADTSSPPAVLPRVDLEYLTNLGLEHRLPAWRKACLNGGTDATGARLEVESFGRGLQG